MWTTDYSTAPQTHFARAVEGAGDDTMACSRPVERRGFTAAECCEVVHMTGSIGSGRIFSPSMTTDRPTFRTESPSTFDEIGSSDGKRSAEMFRPAERTAALSDVSAPTDIPFSLPQPHCVF